MILDLILSFSCGMLEIMDAAMATLSWDPRDFGSQTEEMLLYPGDPGSCLGKSALDLPDAGACTIIMSLYLENPLHPVKYGFWFPIYMRSLNLSTAEHVNHILIQSFCIDLKTSASCSSSACYYERNAKCGEKFFLNPRRHSPFRHPRRRKGGAPLPLAFPN